MYMFFFVKYYVSIKFVKKVYGDILFGNCFNELFIEVRNDV